MGEKETGTATEEGERRQHGPGPVRLASDPGDVDGDGPLDEGPVSVVKTKTKSNQSNDRLGREDDPAAVDGEGGGAPDEDPVSNLQSKTYDQKTNDRGDRQASGGLSPDTDQPNDLDDDGDAVSRVLKTKTKSNQSNDRLVDQADPDGSGVVQYNESDLEFRQPGDGDDPAQAAINNSHSNIKNLRSGAGGLDDDGDGVAGVINTTRSNIKSTS